MLQCTDADPARKVMKYNAIMVQQILNYKV